MNKKRTKIIYIALILLAFVTGIIVSQYMISGFTEPSPVVEHVSEEPESPEVFFDYSKNIVEDLISVNPENVESIREKMTTIIFGTSQLPDLLPDSIYEITDTLYSDISNLKTIEQFEIVQKYNIQSVGYIFKPKKDNHRLFIYHQGHGGDFILGKHVIKYFVNKGFTVYAFCMPLYGKNNEPTVTIDKIGTYKLKSDFTGLHELMKFLDNPISFFAAPIVAMINYAQPKNFKNITMCGISGGGWTTTIVSAIDTRINFSFPVAGTYPMYIKLNTPPKSFGDFEQVYSPLYRNVNYLDMYILGATGKNRFQVQVLNQHDPCVLFRWHILSAL